MTSLRQQQKQSEEEQTCIFTLEGFLGLFPQNTSSSSSSSSSRNDFVETFDGGPRGVSVSGLNGSDSDGSNETPESFRRKTRLNSYGDCESYDSHDGGGTSIDNDTDYDGESGVYNNVLENNESSDGDEGNDFMRWLNAKAAAVNKVNGYEKKWDPFNVDGDDEEYITLEEKKKFKRYAQRGVNLFAITKDGQTRPVVLKLERGGEITVEHDEYITTILPRHVKGVQRGVITKVQRLLDRSKDPIVCQYPTNDVMKRCFSIILRGTTKAIALIESYPGQAVILYRGFKSLIDDKLESLSFPKIHKFKPTSNDDVDYSSDQTTTSVSSNSYWGGSQISTQNNTPR